MNPKPITAEVVHTVRIKVTFGGTEQDMTLEEVRTLHSTLSRALDSVLGTHGLTPIVTRVTEEFGVSRGQIMGRDRHERIARTRQVTMYLARELTALPLESIGAYFGGRDHGTVSAAHRRIRHFVEVYPKWREKISKLKTELGPGIETSLPVSLPIEKMTL